MATLTVWIDHPGPMTRALAQQSLARAAAAAGHTLRPLDAPPPAPSDLPLIWASSENPPAGAPVVHTDAEELIRDAAGVLARLEVPAPATARAVAPQLPEQPQSPAGQAPERADPGSGPRIVGVTSCPTGIAHTFMAAEGLQGGAQALGYAAKVETQGSVGAGNVLSEADIAGAEVVIVAADTNVDLGRFAGKRVYQTGTKEAIRDGQGLVQRALAGATVYGAAGDGVPAPPVAAGAGARGLGAEIYKHLMTGVSHMLPLVVAGGLLIALAFAIGAAQFGDQGIFIYEEQYAGTLGNTLFNIGANGAFVLFVPVLAGFIAFSIADRPGLAPGLVAGLLANTAGAGFLGGIVAGFLAGYLTRWLNRSIRLPRNLEGLKPTLLLPLLGTAAAGLLMLYVIAAPVANALASLTAWLNALGQSSAGLLGALLGGMMAFDMGGPINKAAYTFSTGLIDAQVYGPIAAVMAAGMTPPLAIFLATALFKNRFTPDERQAGKAAGVLGLSFITEGAIPFAARDPLRVIPSLIAGSAVAGAVSMAAGCLLRAPHGGVFVLAIPGAVTNLPMYIAAIVAGTVVSTALLGLLKRPLDRAEVAVAQQESVGAPARR